MSSQIFENREDDFKNLCEDLKRKLDQLSSFTGESRKRLIRDIERGIEEASILMQEMEEELRKAPAPYRSKMVSKVREYKKDLEQITRSLAKSNSSGGMSESYGFDRANDFESAAEDQRRHLLHGTEVLHRASESIGRSHRIAAETDEIGNDIMGELGSQRESLVRTRDRLVDTEQNLSRSRKILNAMGRRLMTNKMILAVIIFLELGILGGVVYWKFFS